MSDSHDIRDRFGERLWKTPDELTRGEEGKQYAAFGKGFSGQTDDLEEAKAWVEKNGGGAIYVRIPADYIKHWEFRKVKSDELERGD